MRWAIGLLLLSGCLLVAPPPNSVDCELDGPEIACPGGERCDLDFGGCIDYCTSNSDCQQPDYHCCGEDDWSEECDFGDCIRD
jgi:hypothetical protein